MNEFQSLLGELVLKVRPKTYVETGFMTGESAKAVVEAMDKNGLGKAYSIEPHVNYSYSHPRLTVVKGFSFDVMPGLFMETGSWDIFLHDSNHDVGCMSFEIELAWRFVTPGGIVACDDYTWGTPPHRAWDKFCIRHKSIPIQLGSVQYVVKPKDEPVAALDALKRNILEAESFSNFDSITYGAKPLFP